MNEQTEEQVKILKADEVVKYLETIVVYLEAVQQDMITNINNINSENKESNDNA
jgi:hypothetical protein